MEIRISKYPVYADTLTSLKPANKYIKVNKETNRVKLKCFSSFIITLHDVCIYTLFKNTDYGENVSKCLEFLLWI